MSAEAEIKHECDDCGRDKNDMVCYCEGCMDTRYEEERKRGYDEGYKDANKERDEKE